MRECRVLIKSSPYAIRTNCICPWMTETRMVTGIDEQWREAGLPRNQPSEVAKIIAGKINHSAKAKHEPDLHILRRHGSAVTKRRSTIRRRKPSMGDRTRNRANATTVDGREAKPRLQQRTRGSGNGRRLVGLMKA